MVLSLVVVPIAQQRLYSSVRFRVSPKRSND